MLCNIALACHQNDDKKIVCSVHHDGYGGLRDKCGMFVVCRIQCCMHVRVNCYVVRGCVVSKRYIHVFNSDVFSVVYMYYDHLKFCIVCIDGRRYVCCSEYYVVFNKRNVSIPDLCDISVRTLVKLCTL